MRTGEALTPEQMVLRGEELERLYKAASSLSLIQQQVLQLRLVLHSPMALSFLQEKHMSIRDLLWLQVLFHRFIHTYEECSTRMNWCRSFLPTALCFCARQQSVLPQLLFLPAALLRAVLGQAHG